MIVVDASVAVKWLLEEPGSDQALALAENQRLLAPTLLRAEVGSALWKKVGRGDIAADAATIAFGAIGAFIAEWVELDELDDTAFALALELRHPIYDCYYLALAQARATKLVTADRRLIERCATSSVKTIVEAL